MKKFVSTLVLMSSFSALATDALVVTLTARDLSPEEGWRVIKLTSINSKLKKAGLEQFPATVTLTKNDGKIWMKYVDLVEKANKKLKTELEILPDDNLTWGSTMCYLGSPQGVLKTLEGLTGTMIDEDMGIWGYRIGKKVSFTYPGEFIDNPEYREELMNYNPREIKEWDNYNTKSDAVLLSTNYGPSGDGTEMNNTLIKRCK